MPSYGKLCFLLSGTISGLASFLMFLNSRYVAKWISGGEAEETSRVLKSYPSWSSCITSISGCFLPVVGVLKGDNSKAGGEKQ